MPADNIAGGALVHPPELLTLDSTTLRRWRVTDAEALDRVMRDNLEHLRPWMSWVANEPLDLDARRRQMARWEDRWSNGEKYGWGISTDDQLIGACDIGRGDPGVWIIGYWVAREALQRGHGARSARLITNAAFALPGTTTVSAYCDAANVGSNAVLRAVGFDLVRAFDGDIFAPAETGRVHVYRRTTPISD